MILAKIVYSNLHTKLCNRIRAFAQVKLVKPTAMFTACEYSREPASDVIYLLYIRHNNMGSYPPLSFLPYILDDWGL